MFHQVGFFKRKLLPQGIEPDPAEQEGLCENPAWTGHTLSHQWLHENNVTSMYRLITDIQCTAIQVLPEGLACDNITVF